MLLVDALIAAHSRGELLNTVYGRGYGPESLNILADSAQRRGNDVVAEILREAAYAKMLVRMNLLGG